MSNRGSNASSKSDIRLFSDYEPGFRRDFHIDDNDFFVTTRPGESPMCSICRKMLDLVPKGHPVTCNIKVERRAKDRCHICELFSHRIRDLRHFRRIVKQDDPDTRFIVPILSRFPQGELHIFQSD
jgi:hypothetical protein